MNNKEILIVIIKKDELNYNLCLKSIKRLAVPVNYVLSIVTCNIENNNIAASYNEIIRNSNAKYKIYLKPEMFFINKKFLFEMLSIFMLDFKVGMISLSGSKEIPINGHFKKEKLKCGKIYIKKQGIIRKKIFSRMKEPYENVRIIDGNLIATQYDLTWQENDFYEDCLYEMAQCQEFLIAGYKVVVPNQKIPWCICNKEKQVSINENYEIFKQKFFRKYFSYMHDEEFIKKNKYMFYKFGRNSSIGSDCSIGNAEGICIEADCKIGSDAHLALLQNNYAGEPRLTIEEGCILGSRVSIVALSKVIIEKNVMVGNNVRITDFQHENLFNNTNISKNACLGHKCLMIGRGSYIEDNSVIAGEVKIGRGCTIKANSVVFDDVPDYSIVKGNPAKVIRYLEKQMNSWIEIENQNQLSQLQLKRMNDSALLTIAIPTYNRAPYLKHCLKSIFNQIGDDPLFEVLISDNNSTDETANVVKEYAMKYGNVVYHKNKMNIGGDKNILLVSELAQGEFIALLGDDDYYHEGALYHLVDTIYQHRNCSLIYLAWIKNQERYEVYTGSGMNEYLDTVSVGATWISSLVFNKSTLRLIPVRDKFSDTAFNQLYLQFELLRLNPNFLIITGPIFSNETSNMNQEMYTYNLAEIFLRQYIDILLFFQKENELQKTTIKKAMKKLLDGFIFPRVIETIKGNFHFSLDNIINIYSFYYKEEDYYLEKKKELEELLKNKIFQKL